MKITKAVIPAAGFGTRVLPATKNIPKEMFPIVDKPTIQGIPQQRAASEIRQMRSGKSLNAMRTALSCT